MNDRTQMLYHINNQQTTVMLNFDPSSVPHRDLHQILLSGVAPRPIAFVTSKDRNGNINLAPFSFFNAYASKPPVVAIGPAISAATGTTKDTYLNIMETQECTISAVTYPMVQRMNIASAVYPHGTDEYDKAGFTKAPAMMVGVPYVSESPFVLECRLIRNIELFREDGGNGNIMLLRVLNIMVNENAMTEDKIDPRKLDLVARLGYKWYSHINADSLFELGQPRGICAGFDALPESIKRSTILSANDIHILAATETLPQPLSDEEAQLLFAALNIDFTNTGSVHTVLHTLLAGNRTDEAWHIIRAVNA
ncbi:MAG: flavin reductase family protein [Candidatus Kapabacteria bacterium]|nr:flavin reductase family protein [Candidatus Kapabacteria bacterium]